MSEVPTGDAYSSLLRDAALSSGGASPSRFFSAANPALKQLPSKALKTTQGYEGHPLRSGGDALKDTAVRGNSSALPPLLSGQGGSASPDVLQKVSSEECTKTGKESGVVMSSVLGWKDVDNCGSKELHTVENGILDRFVAGIEHQRLLPLWGTLDYMTCGKALLEGMKGIPVEVEGKEVKKCREEDKDDDDDEEDPYSFALREKGSFQKHSDPESSEGVLIAPSHGTQDRSTNTCVCPVCKYQYFVYFFFSSQRRASSHVLYTYPNYYVEARALPPLPFAVDPGLGNMCPIYSAWGFCPHSVGCYLPHDADYEAELHFLPRASAKDIRKSLPWRHPQVKRGGSAQEELERLRKKAAVHLRINEWTCDVCGHFPILESDVQPVGESFFYRACPYCNLSCCMPEVTYLLEHILWNAKDDYQLYKYLVDCYRSLLPDEFKVPFFSEAHQLATTVFAWSLVSPLDLQQAINAAYRVLPSLASVVSIGSGVGYVEHLLNRVMNNVDLPAFGPVVAWRKAVEKARRRRQSSAPRENASHSTCIGEGIHSHCSDGLKTDLPHCAAEATIRDADRKDMLEYPSSISKEKACFYGKRVVPVFAFDELVRRYEFSVHVSLGGPLSVLSVDCENSVLLLCWPPFGSRTEEQSSMGFEALEYFHQRRGKVLIFVGDVCSTGDWRFHELREKHYKLVREYPVRQEVNRWCPQQMGLVYGGNDTIGVYERR